MSENKEIEQPQKKARSRGSALNALLACPFCGNDDIREDYSEYDNNITYWVECEKCEIILERDTKRQAVEDWNTRAS